MAVDITLLFRASVKTVKTRNKALGVAVGGGADGSRDELFRRSPRPKSDFSSRAREVVSWLLWKRRAGEGGGPATWTPDPKPAPGRWSLCEGVAWRKWSGVGDRRADSCLGKGTASFRGMGRHVGEFEKLLSAEFSGCLARY